ncbi:MAG: hypothetical protein LBQ06_01050, partial [Frankiaceae bacterium]|nr:hypothetical protein [Frankiaceae bacterium]
AQSALGGGGRYDGLMAQLGGPALSGIGYGLGIDRTLLALRAEGLAPGDAAAVDVYLVPIGDAARQRCVPLAGALRFAGARVDMAYGGRGLKGAMKGADRSGAAVAVLIGDRDLAAGAAQIKDLHTGEQRSAPLDELVAAVLGALGAAPEHRADPRADHRAEPGIAGAAAAPHDRETAL